METEYIEFILNDEDKFEDLLQVFTLISNAKKSGDFKSDEFWLNTFPDYALKHYSFAKTDLKPEFETASYGDGTWYFYAMTQHLIENLEVDFLECKKTKTGEGRLTFYPHAYPYGGITGMAMFLNSFGFKATKIDEGGGVYKVQWKSETEFQLTQL